MSTSRVFVRGVLTLGLLSLLSSYGLAAERSTVGPGGTVLKRASRMMNARIKSPDGQTLGSVHDLVLTPDLNGISYVAVSSGGFLGMGNTLHAVPWSALSESVNGAYTIPVSVAQFKQSRGFRPSSWPSSAESGWAIAGEEPVYRAPAAGAENVSSRRFTRIRGLKVKDIQGGSAGSIHDLVIAMDSGQIAYTVVSYGGILGLGQRFTAVPESAITLEPARHMAQVNASKTVLEANSFSPNQWPDLASPSYSEALARTFGIQPSEAALAYVPPAPVAAAPRATPPAPHAPAPPAPSTTPAAPTPSELTGTFNPSTITMIDGTVVDVGKFRATATGEDMLWLRVRTADGRTVLVNLGPRMYVSTQDFYVVPGDRIHLAGSEVAAAATGKRVFLPTQVTYSNHVLRLRSETGTPLWEGQTATPGATPPSHSATGQTPATETPPPQTATPDLSGTHGTRSGIADEPNEPNKP
jgi:sporulation protein YlmC with PRC-barrel domain